MTVPALWFMGLVQFIVCGLFACLILVAVKTHHFPEGDRPILYGMLVTVSMIAGFGLVIMGVHHIQ